MRLTYTHYYLGINLPKETKDLYTENYKTLIKEIKGNINRPRDIPCSWIGRINTVKMTILPKAFPIKYIPYQIQFIWIGIQRIPYQITKGIFHRTRTKTSTVHMKTQKNLIAKTIFGKKNRTRRTNLPDFRHTIKLQSSRQHCTGTKQKYRPIEQDRNPRDKPTHLWAPYLWQRRQEYTMEIR